MEHHPRHIIHNFIPLHICKELEFIHKSNCTVGYRPNVFSTTLSHLIATNCPHLIMPFIPIREMVKEKVEELFGCEFELFVEFTGLISWTKGASIGWHSDDNRSYLKQRDFTAVCYLNSYGENFSGGIFHFQDGEPANYVPMAGDLVMYSADDRNIHCVDEITDGERLTLTIWFSRNSSYDEDEKLISRVAQTLSNNELTSCIPLPGSSNMYWFSSVEGSDQLQGFDIRYARLLSLGYDISTTQGKTSDEMNSTIDVSDVFTEPLRLARGDTLFNKKFANLLHALQAVQFYYWSRSNLPQTEGVRNTGDIIQLSESQKQDICNLRCLLSSTMKLDASIFCHPSSNTIRDSHFDPKIFSEALTSWEEYAFKLHEQLTVHLPFWKEYTSLFSVSLQVVNN
ncbi:uncharacterized protein LOC141644017 [Silene latifolia]|uniref:uncharacterized protein LOC141644017 n=1 Tax=Silene latifolia TaxID=37657 RepID=UPI003D78A0E1